ncbi:MAG: DUF4221 domain-containing protein [Parabacteroides distasonis]|nr:DUF4221 domain-containing protein [Parabacteroides distasonis]
MKTKLVIIVVSFFFLAACNQFTSSSKDRLGKQMYSMQELAHKRFQLDDSTTQVLSYVQTFAENDTLKLALYNKPLHNICFFDVNSGRGIGKVQLKKEGPHAIGNDIRGFLYINRDSIFVYQYWKKRLLLLNNKGEILRKYELLSKILSEPLPNTNLPIKKVGDEIILQGQGLINNPIGVTSLFNLKENNIRCVNPYPYLYYGDNKDNIWQTFAYNVIPYTLNNHQEMVLSFPADDSIRVYNIKTGKTDAYFAGYSKDYPIRPAKSPSEKNVEEHVYKQIQYAGIYYDQWNDLYYRILTLPLFDYDVNAKEFLDRNIAVIILDSTFEKVGEYNLMEKTRLCSHCFVSKEGLHINTISEDDDFLTFITLSVFKL